MKARTPEQLAIAIESLVSSYFDEVGQAAHAALERSLCEQTAVRRASKGRSHAPKLETKRRTAAELDAACEQLCALVRSQPGESIVTLAEAMGVRASTLQRRMAKLRVENRVRTVGERHLMRYSRRYENNAAKG